MNNKEIGIEIAHKLINFNNVNNENYLPLVDKFLKDYSIDDRDKSTVMNAMIHEWSILGYEIVSTHPFKLKGSRD